MFLLLTSYESNKKTSTVFYQTSKPFGWVIQAELQKTETFFLWKKNLFLT